MKKLNEKIFGPNKRISAAQQRMLKYLSTCILNKNIQQQVYYLPEYDEIRLGTFPDWTCLYIELGPL